ncbi:hypothetical protein EDB19DRAFT_202052 [Suillus lakei]|nr:hypothetical protein EDB19DRAFT_202052 [Suillus lakei]
MATSGFFSGNTSMEVITTIATSGHDINTVRQAVIMYIVAKKKKRCSEQHIHEKLEKLELKFKDIEELHPAWRDARALFQLRKSNHIPMPMSIVREREDEQRRQLEWESSSMTPSSSSTSTYTSSSASTRLSSAPSTSNSPLRLSWDSTSKQDLPRAEEDTPIGHHTPSHAHPSRCGTALSSLSEYSDESEPDDPGFISPSGNPQN